MTAIPDPVVLGAMEPDEHYMRLALAEAEAAARVKDVPVGSIVDLHLDEVTSRMYTGGEPMIPEYWHAPVSTSSGVVVAMILRFSTGYTCGYSN